MSTCVLCFKEFAPARCTTSFEAHEHKQCLENFFEFLEIPGEERIRFQNFDFARDLPFCKECYSLPKELREQSTSNGKLEEEILALQQLVSKKIRELSKSMEKLEMIVHKVKEQVELSEKEKMEKVVQEEPQKEKVEELDEEDVPSRNDDEKVKRLRQLILEWTPEHKKVTGEKYSYGSASMNRGAGKIIQAYPANFLVPTSLNQKDENIAVKLEPLEYELEDTFKSPTLWNKDKGKRHCPGNRRMIGEDEGVRNSESFQTPNSQEDEDRNSNEALRGLMGEEFENLDENSSASQKEKETSRKRKAINETLLEAESKSYQDEFLDSELEELTKDGWESDGYYDDESMKKFKPDCEEPLSAAEEQTALSYKHWKTLGKFEILNDMMTFKGIEIKKNGTGYECGACKISKPCNFTDLYSIRLTGQELREHIHLEHLGGLKCQWCTENPEPFVSTVFDTFLTHIQTEHQIPEYECNICGKPFMQRKNFLTHQQWSHKNEQERADANKKRKDELEMVPINHQCIHCQKIFATGNDLKRHSKKHLDEFERDKLRIPCQYCGKTYFPTSIQQHLKFVHNKSQLHWHSCEFCGMKFYREAVLARHIRRVHSLTKEVAVKPFSCKFCDQIFTSLDGLKSHNEQIHTGELPIESSEYGLTFSRSSSVRQIIVPERGNPIKSEESPKVRQSQNRSSSSQFHQCTICPSSFARRDRLTRHTNTVHSDVIGCSVPCFNCELCDSSFKRSDRLSRHMKTVHSNVRVMKNEKVQVQNTPVSHLTKFQTYPNAEYQYPGQSNPNPLIMYQNIESNPYSLAAQSTLGP